MNQSVLARKQFGRLVLGCAALALPGCGSSRTGGTMSGTAGSGSWSPPQQPCQTSTATRQGSFSLIGSGIGNVTNQVIAELSALGNPMMVRQAVTSLGDYATARCDSSCEPTDATSQRVPFAKGQYDANESREALIFARMAAEDAIVAAKAQIRPGDIALRINGAADGAPTPRDRRVSVYRGTKILRERIRVNDVFHALEFVPGQGITNAELAALRAISTRDAIFGALKSRGVDPTPMSVALTATEYQEFGAHYRRARFQFDFRLPTNC